jgi:hypothetical protein
VELYLDADTRHRYERERGTIASAVEQAGGVVVSTEGDPAGRTSHETWPRFFLERAKLYDLAQTLLEKAGVVALSLAHVAMKQWIWDRPVPHPAPTLLREQGRS